MQFFSFTIWIEGQNCQQKKKERSLNITHRRERVNEKENQSEENREIGTIKT